MTVEEFAAALHAELLERKREIWEPKFSFAVGVIASAIDAVLVAEKKRIADLPPDHPEASDYR